MCIVSARVSNNLKVCLMLTERRFKQGTRVMFVTFIVTFPGFTSWSECVEQSKSLSHNIVIWSKVCCLLQHGGLWGEKGNMWNHLSEIPPVCFQLSVLGKFTFWHCSAFTEDLIANVLVLVLSASQVLACFGQSFPKMQTCL